MIKKLLTTAAILFVASSSYAIEYPAIFDNEYSFEENTIHLALVTMADEHCSNMKGQVDIHLLVNDYEKATNTNVYKFNDNQKAMLNELFIAAKNILDSNKADEFCNTMHKYLKDNAKYLRN